MPGGLFEADTAFPELSAKKTTEEKLRAVQDYLYMLLETLRWTLRHLSADNFDEAGAASLLENVEESSPEVITEIITNTIISNTVISNTIVTNEIYAQYGAVADLTVDELRTDYRKAERYLAGNTAALDYLYIHDEQIDFLTGTVKTASGTALTEQLHHGDRYFWWTDGTRTRMTSTEDTGYPVTVYQYDELLKGTIRFEDYTAGGVTTKVPTFIFGAGYGDPQDAAKGKGFIRKGTSSFDIWLHNNSAEDRGLFIGEQYTDIVGLRKTAAIDFSGWDGGRFSETLDGNVSNSYVVTFDASARPVKITDAAGHETAVIWE